MSEGRTKEQWESIARSYQKHITRLQNEVEKMKCCANCKYCEPLGDSWCCTLTENYCRVYPRETKICKGWELAE